LGTPFADHAEQGRLASLAALEMLSLVPQLQAELPELLGIRTLPKPSICASASPPARCWSAASAPN